MNWNYPQSINDLDLQGERGQLASDSWQHQVVVATKASVIMLLLCGGLYTGGVTMLGQWLFPHQATGSLIQVNGKTLGSELVGQAFVSDHYFHGRPSAAGYDPMATGGSNLASDNPELRERVAADSTVIQLREGVQAVDIPVDMLAASGAGLDPHISSQAAYLQVPRIARERQWDEAKVKAVISAHIEAPQWGMLGQPRVNVLKLNLALDAMSASSQ